MRAHPFTPFTPLTKVMNQRLRNGLGFTRPFTTIRKRSKALFIEEADMQVPTPDQLSNDPLVIGFIHAARTKPPLHMTPMLALGEKRAVAYLLLTGRFRDLANDGQTLVPIPPDIAHRLAHDVYAATVVYLDGDACSLFTEINEKVIEAYAIAGANRPSPKNDSFDLTWLRMPYKFRMENYGACDAQLLLSARLSVGGADTISFSNVALTTIRAHREQSFHDALEILLQQKIAVLHEEQPNRQFRKKAKQLGIRDDETVRVLRLRPIERDDGTEMDAESARQYRHRWLVRGHIRNQWFPSRQQHELVWIDPHQKGPDGAPFKETVRHVIR